MNMKQKGLFILLLVLALIPQNGWGQDLTPAEGYGAAFTVDVNYTDFENQEKTVKMEFQVLDESEKTACVGAVTVSDLAGTGIAPAFSNMLGALGEGKYVAGTIYIPSKVTYNDSQYSVVGICKYDVQPTQNPFAGLIIDSQNSDISKQFITLEFPETITQIPDYAFAGLSDDSGSLLIKGVSFKGAISNIGTGSFRGCKNLTNVSGIDGVTSIGQDAFSGCSSLDIQIPTGVTSIGSGAFSGTGITSVTIPNGVTTISDRTFLGCTELTTLVLPSTITSIGTNAFGESASLTTLTVECSSLDGGWFGDSDNGNSITSLELGESVTSVLNGNYFSNLESVTYNCSKYFSLGSDEKVKSVTLGEKLADMDNNELSSGITSLTISSLTWPTGLTIDLEYLESLTLSEGMKSIGNDAFKNIGSVEEITLPSTITSIGDKAFYELNIKTISLPNSIETIGNEAFGTLEDMTEITLPNSLTTIGYGAFSSAENLTSMTIPANVTSIGKDAFPYSLKFVDLSATNLSYTTVGRGDSQAYTPFGNLEESALIYLPTNSNVTEKNVVVNGVCEELALSKNADLYVPTAFTAKKVTLGDNYYIADMINLVSFPFAISTPAEYGTFYEYKQYDAENNLATFEVTNTVEANKGYLFVAKELITGKITINEQTLISANINTTASDGLNGVFQSQQIDENGLVLGYDNDYNSVFKTPEEEREQVLAPYTAYLKLNGVSAPINYWLKGGLSAYAVFDNGTFTFKYDTEKPYEGSYDITNNYNWNGIKSSLTKIVFEESMKEYTGITSTKWWFSECSNINEIDGLENLNITKMTSKDMDYMFSQVGTQDAPCLLNSTSELLAAYKQQKSSDGTIYGGYFIFSDSQISISMTEGNAWATYYQESADYKVDDENIEVYAITEIDETAGTVMIEKLDGIPASVPVLLHSTDASGFSSTIDLVESLATISVSSPDNRFKGVTERKDISTDGTVYVLVGNVFVKGDLADGANKAIAANKCYISLSSAGTRLINIVYGDNATGIKSVVKIMESEDDKWYDLQGRSIAQPLKKGLYIKNGKKVVLK